MVLQNKATHSLVGMHSIEHGQVIMVGNAVIHISTHLLLLQNFTKQIAWFAAAKYKITKNSLK